MPEELEACAEPRYLEAWEKELSRPLYESVFPEDTKKFVDYYYQYKIRDNQILAIQKEGRIVSMLHLNPYTMIVNGYEVQSNYIVAVGTHKDYRKRGYMRLLLERALQDMSRQQTPFTFLMPASESIYAPFDFVWICSHTELSPRLFEMNAEEQNRYLASRYQMFCRRDERYLENQAAERQAEEGEAPLEKIPPYMARVTDAEQMLRMVRSRQEQKLYLHIKDPIIEKNDGYFLWSAGPGHGKAEKLDWIPERLDLELTIGELTSMVFESFRICLSELV